MSIKNNLHWQNGDWWPKFNYLYEQTEIYGHMVIYFAFLISFATL